VWADRGLGSVFDLDLVSAAGEPYGHGSLQADARQDPAAGLIARLDGAIRARDHGMLGLAQMRVTHGEAVLDSGRWERVAGRRDRGGRSEEDKPGGCGREQCCGTHDGSKRPTRTSAAG
jgi:hypothetical protein